MRNRRTVCLCVALLAGAMAISAYAKNQPDDQPNRGGSEPYAVVSHVSLPGTPATQMRLQRDNGREYLYLLRSSGTGFTVVDVTKPQAPSVVKKVTLAAGTSINGLNVAGNTLAITEGSNVGNNGGEVPSQSIQLFDTQDPANPKLLQKFHDVTSVLAEDGRHLVYIATKDGLYIVRRPVKATRHPCTSADQMSAMPNCY
jgi:hypothetical protein